MAVEKIGDDATAYRQATCKRCGSILRYLPKDVKHAMDSDWTGGHDSYSYIKCPECKNTVYVKESR